MDAKGADNLEEVAKQENAKWNSPFPTEGIKACEHQEMESAIKHFQQKNL